ncbi:hypothetical protein SUGI_0233080 [Cryptomeria japonica]|nr:hypothetical protein SUGI_0233080 [Cryptomeria japonica]
MGERPTLNLESKTADKMKEVSRMGVQGKENVVSETPKVNIMNVDLNNKDIEAQRKEDETNEDMFKSETDSEEDREIEDDLDILETKCLS